MVKLRGSDLVPPMKVAYEHVRLKPQGEQTVELGRNSLKDELLNVKCEAGTEDVEESKNKD